MNGNISIHAPLRERPSVQSLLAYMEYFNPRSLAGATESLQKLDVRGRNFNPRSLAGATISTL